MSDDAPSYRQIEQCELYGADDMQQLRLRVLREMCEGFDGDPSTFASIVSWAVEVLPIEDRDLAEKWSVPISTVSRWANGTTAPLPKLQRAVADGIREMAVEQMEADDGE